MKKICLLPLALLAFVYSSCGQKSPETFLGYQIGTAFTPHHRVMDYFRHVADSSERVIFQTYGETYEGRPLTYAIISSEKNLEQLDQIRRHHLRSIGLSKEDAGPGTGKAIVWMSYNVHGNEASSSEAAMLTLYELATQRQEWLENTVVIIDPMVNPDGRQRYVNWYKQVRADPYNPSPMAIEHVEPWPGGRPNHYLFDLNRDWAWATQKETRERLELYNKWMPHIHVDFHEQGVNEPYYFAPAAAPFHEVITPFQREFQTQIGKNNARYFDERGWLYFTKEYFDLLYPSYGDTYPTYMGAIGMTYEQAGHGRAGLGIRTSEGGLLTLKERALHHHIAGLSTVEMAARNYEKLNEEFEKYFKNNTTTYKSFVVQGDSDKLRELRALLNTHGITYFTTRPQRLRGWEYDKKESGTLEIEGDHLVVTTDQPKGRMVKVLFEPRTKLVDSLTYDITAWSLPYAYGLEAIATEQELEPVPFISEEPVSNDLNSDAAGYLSSWDSMTDAAFLSALLREGIRVRFTEKAVETGGTRFQPGSLLITRSDNMETQDYLAKLSSIADRFNRRLTAATTGFSSSGPDFGSSSFRPIHAPRVAVLRGPEISSLNYGEIWYFFEQELDYPLTSIGTDYFADIELSEIDLLILPSGNYQQVLGGETLERLTAWVENGGRILAMGEALEFFAGKNGFDLEKNKFDKPDSTNVDNLIPYSRREREAIKQSITGAIVTNQVDSTHPLAFGYGNNYMSLKLGSDSYAYLDEGYNVVYLRESPEIAAGFAGVEAREKIGKSMTFGVEPVGQGSLIYMVDDPLFRAFWQNGKLFFANAIFFVNNDDLR